MPLGRDSSLAREYHLLLPLTLPAYLLCLPTERVRVRNTKRGLYSSFVTSDLSLKRASDLQESRGELGSETRSIILDHAYRIAAAHSASLLLPSSFSPSFSLDHPGRSLGHSRDFHSSGERSPLAGRLMKVGYRSRAEMRAANPRTYRARVSHSAVTQRIPKAPLFPDGSGPESVLPSSRRFKIGITH